MFKAGLITFFILLALAAGALYLSFDRVLTYVLAKSYNLDISYEKTCGRFVYAEMVAADRRTGMGFSADRASFGARWNSGPVIGFDLKGVHFVKRQAEESGGAYDSLIGLVAVPFDSRWVYTELSGEVMPVRGGVKIKDLTAVSDEIKLSFSGYIYSDDTVKGDIIIYFAETFMKKVPDELSKVLLNDEKDSWKSLSVHLEGNYKEPSMQVSGSRFRLNIRTIAAGES